MGAEKSLPQAWWLSVRPALNFLTVGLVLAAALAGAVWLWWPLQPTVLGTHDDGAAASRASKVAVAVAQPRGPDAGGVEPLPSLARRAPAEAWLRAAAMEESAARGSTLKVIAALWVARDPSGAMSAFEAMDGDLFPAGWMFEMLARGMIVDEEAAADWALSTTGGRRPLLISGAIDWLLKHADNREPAIALAERVFRRWAQEEPADAWEAVAESRLAGESDSLRRVAEAWFEVDPRTALDAAVSDNLWRHRWVPDLVAQWAEAAPRAATEWALALTPGPYDPSIDEVSRFGDRAKLLAPALAALSVAAPDEAFAAVQEFGEAHRNRIQYNPRYWQQLRKLLGDDPRDLAAWLGRQPDESLRISQARSIAGLYWEANPHEALQWALELPPKESGQALLVLVPSIADENPHYAEDIVLGLVESDAQILAAISLLGHWTRELGPAAAYEWSVENLSAAVRREMNHGLFGYWGLLDPVWAVSALERIVNPDERRMAGHQAGFGIFMGIYGDDTPQQRRERMLALDRLYQELLDITPPSLRSDDGDVASYKLYHYWKDIDPERASKHREKAERYDGPTQ